MRTSPGVPVAGIATAIILITAAFLLGLHWGATRPGNGSLGSGTQDLTASGAEEVLIRDLRDRAPEIIGETIGMEPVLGGTMGFHGEESILILNDKWVYVRFEDGHIGGEAILGYRFARDDSIHWSLVELAPY
ncbi:MAG: hypothetical protein EA427_16110 [Spirochaetaceae bacterium]|nr:MAG: hypothetical protein EA427_16110 [Spirochaetaceae bacterium]